MRQLVPKLAKILVATTLLTLVEFTSRAIDMYRLVANAEGHSLD